jgi:hypothetical protein
MAVKFAPNGVQAEKSLRCERLYPVEFEIGAYVASWKTAK